MQIVSANIHRTVVQAHALARKVKTREINHRACVKDRVATDGIAPTDSPGGGIHLYAQEVKAMKLPARGGAPDGVIRPAIDAHPGAIRVPQVDRAGRVGADGVPWITLPVVLLM